MNNTEPVNDTIPPTRPLHSFVSWRRLLADGPTPVQESFRVSEESATRIRYYNDHFIPGPLQTPGYARAIMAAVMDCYGVDGDPDASAAARLKRRRVLDDPAKSVGILVHERALYWRVGSADVMDEQLRSLFGLLEAGLDWGIVPDTAPYHPYMPTRGFDLLDGVACEEAVGGLLFVTDPDAIADYERSYAHAAEQALRGPAAEQLIRRALVNTRRWE